MLMDVRSPCRLGNTGDALVVRSGGVAMRPCHWRNRSTRYRPVIFSASGSASGSTAAAIVTWKWYQVLRCDIGCEQRVPHRAARSWHAQRSRDRAHVVADLARRHEEAEGRPFALAIAWSLVFMPPLLRPIRRSRSRFTRRLDAPRAPSGRSHRSLSCCRFRGHRDKVFLEPEDGDATREVQP